MSTTIIKTLQPSHAYPYRTTTSAAASPLFTLPLELRHQIYSYVFATPTLPFPQKTLKGWREPPSTEDLTYEVNGTQLLGVSKRLRAEALPLLYRSVVWRMEGFEMLRSWLNTAMLADLAHLHVRRVSILDWHAALSNLQRPRWRDVEQGSLIASALADLPSLRELEMGWRFLPLDRKDYTMPEWLNLLSTLHSNGGVLRIVALECANHDWLTDWSRIGGGNFAWHERVSLKTSVEVRSWDELVEGDWGNFDFADVFVRAMRENWRAGPLKGTTLTDRDAQGEVLRSWKVKFWGVPENVRRSEEVRMQRLEAKKRAEEARKKEMMRKGKGSPRLAVEDEFEDGSGGNKSEMRSRKVVTREDARLERMTRQRRVR